MAAFPHGRAEGEGSSQKAVDRRLGVVDQESVSLHGTVFRDSIIVLNRAMGVLE